MSNDDSNQLLRKVDKPICAAEEQVEKRITTLTIDQRKVLAEELDKLKHEGDQDLYELEQEEVAEAKDFAGLTTHIDSLGNRVDSERAKVTKATGALY